MLLRLALLSTLSVVVSESECYWNRQCSYNLFSTATPYDTIRGDIRDYPKLKNCEAISVWSLHRHGNRNPGKAVINGTKELLAKLRDEIIRSDAERNCSLCSQDIEDILNFEWDLTLDNSPSYLTQVGYKEIYAIGKRIKEKYSELLLGSSDQYYFRSTDKQRTNASVGAFVQGLTDGTKRNLSSCIDAIKAKDDVIRPYENCEAYQKMVKNGPRIIEELAAYDQSPEYLAVTDKINKRLGINYQLTPAEIFSIYEVCRFYRSWSSNFQCPWCSLFTDEDLQVLEYRDDVRHYYRNGYGSLYNSKLGGPALKDLYENFVSAIKGEGKNIVSYFTHDTLVEMVFSALGLFKDPTEITGSLRNESRLWRTSYISSFSTNLIAVLNRCQIEDTYRVQFFINEKVTYLCPAEGCSWQEFVDVFQPFTNSDLSFCSQEQPSVKVTTYTNNYGVSWLASTVLILLSLLGILYSMIIHKI